MSDLSRRTFAIDAGVLLAWGWFFRPRRRPKAPKAIYGTSKYNIAAYGR